MLQEYFEKEKAEVRFLFQKTRAPCTYTSDNDGNQTNHCNGVNEYHSSDILELEIEPALLQ
jgi:hypothetical protein